MIRRLIILLLIVGCKQTVEPLTKHGCFDSQACNYDADATIDNNSCIYVIGCDGVCGSELVEDCAGECGGIAEYDECGVCGGACSRCITTTTTTDNWNSNTELNCYDNIIQTECESYIQINECSTYHDGAGCHCDITTCISTEVLYEAGSCGNDDDN